MIRPLQGAQSGNRDYSKWYHFQPLISRLAPLTEKQTPLQRRRRRKGAAAPSVRAAPVATVHGRRLHNIAQVGSASPAVCLKSIPVGLTHDLAGACVSRHAETRISAAKVQSQNCPLRQLGEITRVEETRTGGRLCFTKRHTSLSSCRSPAARRVWKDLQERLRRDR
jgi:hypothetical protein